MKEHKSHASLLTDAQDTYYSSRKGDSGSKHLKESLGSQRNVTWHINNVPKPERLLLMILLFAENFAIFDSIIHVVDIYIFS